MIALLSGRLAGLWHGITRVAQDGMVVLYNMHYYFFARLIITIRQAITNYNSCKSVANTGLPIVYKLYNRVDYNQCDILFCNFLLTSVDWWKLQSIYLRMEQDRWSMGP